jgi:hypothetical protein
MLPLTMFAVTDVTTTWPGVAFVVAVSPTVPPFRAIASARFVAAWVALEPTANLRPCSRSRPQSA